MNRVLIIAEVGVNHNGDIRIAKDLIKISAEVGADIVKFQTFKSEKLVTNNARKANYQVDSNLGETQLEMLEKLELDNNQIDELIKCAKKNKIEFLSTAFDMDSLDYLIKLNLKRFKIPSGEITNLPYLRKIGEQKKPTILSTGMADMDEINKAVSTLLNSGLSRNLLTIMHCTSEYPAPFDEVNLSALNSLKKDLNLNIGYSDHTIGMEVAIASVALGASVIEKHITLDSSMSGPDHLSSMEPGKFSRMVSSIRNIELSMGDGVKKPTKSEIKNKLVVRKSIYASKDIKKGTVFSENNITIKRPEGGISPMEWDNVIGEKAKKDFLKDEIIFL
tara:strand:- start:4451 stop:5452 length:1002 start_codon:yes stop_codon:yes gene_type:complete